MREVRLRFTKQGRLKCISHLDINRAMSRALTRAKIPLWYTEGYNPHPYISFSLPLSLGVESMCESMNIRIVGDITNDEIKSRMNTILPPGLKIRDVYSDFSDASEIAYSDYVYKFTFSDNDTAIKK
ncbi:MAG: TIGR03936 family radical SAM-associated protein [Clostridiales bacterium]|nr:TIGR03936 family radical SAM-associated protein [Clostridiales bacterium]